MTGFDDPNDTSFWGQARYVIGKVKDFFKWYGETTANLSSSLVKGSVHFLAWLYQIVADFMLGVPKELFTNEWFTHAALVFGSISALFTIVLGSYEGFRQVFFSTNNKQSRSFMDIPTMLKRLPIAIIGSGFAPKLFEWAFTVLDYITSSIIQVGKDQVLGAIANLPAMTGFNWMDAVGIILFDIAFVKQMYPLFMDMASRYFKLLCLGALSPLAISCWIFDEHRGWFDTWLDSIKRIMMIFIYWAIFLTVMGVLIVGIGGTETFQGLIIRLLLIIGCVVTMSNPPSFIKKYTNGEDDLLSMMKETKDLILMKDIRDSKEAKAAKENVKKVNDSKPVKKAKFEGYVLWQMIKNKFKK